MIFKKTSSLLIALSILLFTANIAGAQEQTHQLRGSTTVKGFVGGESHDSYVIRARKGQVLTVQISWRLQSDKDTGKNHAEFFVGQLPNFNGDGRVKFGQESSSGKQWSGKIPKTGDYYIYVTAHPTAHYTLKVTVR